MALPLGPIDPFVVAAAAAAAAAKYAEKSIDGRNC